MKKLRMQTWVNVLHNHPLDSVGDTVPSVLLEVNSPERLSVHQTLVDKGGANFIVYEVSPVLTDDICNVVEERQKVLRAIELLKLSPDVYSMMTRPINHLELDD